LPLAPPVRVGETATYPFHVLSPKGGTSTFILGKITPAATTVRVPRCRSSRTLLADAMPHAHVRNYIHVVFSTEQRRRKLLAPIRPDLFSYITGIARNYGIITLAIGGTEDHVHMVIALPAKLSLSHAISAIKANSSKWMNENGHMFSWQQGYGAFSVSASNLRTVEEYITNQAKHHTKLGFDDEFHALLMKHGIEVDSAAWCRPLGLKT